MKINVTNLMVMENEESNAKANCSIVIEDAIAINGIWIMKGKNGLFVTFPQRAYTAANGEAKYSNVVAPITKKAREEIQGTIIDAYNNALLEEKLLADNALLNEAV